MIVFEKLRWKNLLSTGNQFTEFNLCDTRSTLVIGGNGTGKSTMLDALTYGLFNRPFRKVSKGLLVNSINDKTSSYFLVDFSPESPLLEAWISYKAIENLTLSEG